METAPPRPSSRLRRVGLLVLGIVLVVELVVVLPRLGGVLETFSSVRWRWVFAAVFVSLLSMAAFAGVQRRMLLEGGVRAPLGSVFSAAAAANALSLSVPAGSVLGAAYTYRRMRSWGASPPVAVWGLAATGVLTTVSLAALALLGAVLAGSTLLSSAPPLLALLVLVLAAVALRWAVRHPGHLRSAALWVLSRWNSLRRHAPSRGRAPLERLLHQALVVSPSARGLLSGFSLSLLKWVGDLLCLAAALEAVDAPLPSAGALLVAYAAGAAVSSLPLSPGGIGVVEGALTLALVNTGMPLALALPAVLVYRAVSLGTAYVNGWLCYLFTPRPEPHPS